ncbi:MAG: NAD-dependent epimerase/dehydratase family protein [Burkholderiales bacterium]
MKYLVTGGAGFIGSHLVEALLAQGHQVKVFDNFSTGKRENLAPLPDWLEIINDDIANEQALQETCAGVDGIFHLAAVVSVPLSIEKPAECSRTNALGTVNVFEAARKTKVPRVVYASSAAIYGDNPNLPLSEAEIPAPLSPYGLDKWYGENVAHMYSRLHGVASAGMRFFNVYGPRQDPKSPYSGVISIFMEAARQEKELTIFGNGEQSRDFIYVKDVVTAMQLAMSNPSIRAEVFNVASGTAITLNQLVETMGTSLHKSIRKKYLPPRAGDIVKSTADISRIRSVLGFSTRYSLADGLKATFESLSG